VLGKCAELILLAFRHDTIGQLIAETVVYGVLSGLTQSTISARSLLSN